MKKNSKNGYTLLEVIVATFIFSLVIALVGGFLSRVFLDYNYTKNVQKNFENAQIAMNYIAKVLRTSSIISSASSSTQSITAYDYSQSMCVQFQFNQNNLQYRIISNLTKTNCSETSFSNHSFSNILSGNVDINKSSFFVIPSNNDPKMLGRVTIKMRICPISGGLCVSASRSDAVQIQTTVSLRDYKETTSP